MIQGSRTADVAGRMDSAVGCGASGLGCVRWCSCRGSLVTGQGGVLTAVRGFWDTWLDDVKRVCSVICGWNQDSWCLPVAGEDASFDVFCT